MSRFYVGQRVRKARGDLNVGMEAVVSQLDPGCSQGMTVGVVFAVEADGARNGLIIRVPAGTTLWTTPETLDPIVPPHEPGSWEAIDKLLPNLREVTA